MLSIKLRRVGKKGQASFRLVVAEKRSRTKGTFVEDLGWINPHTDDININAERTRYWTERGAQLTQTAARYLARAHTHEKATAA